MWHEAAKRRLHVGKGLVIALEPAQAGLMERILKAKLVKADRLEAALAAEAADSTASG